MADFVPGTFLRGFAHDPAVEPIDWSKTKVGNLIIATDDGGEVGRWRITEITGPGQFKVEPVVSDG